MRAALILGAWLALATGASAAPVAPDLVLELPGEPYAGADAQAAPVFVDAVEAPGRLLYRFDAVLRNQGGTLDVWRDTVTGEPVQGIWEGGRPDPLPDPASPPPQDAAVTRSVRAAAGARFEYVVEPSHAHWHFFTAAAYAIEAAGEVRRSAKIGFCFFDGFDVAATGDAYFRWERQGPDEETWCGFDAPEKPFVRMGLSPGAADRYASQRELQWVDVTGLPPGPAVLRGVANPDGHFDEGGATQNNAVAVTRDLPGVVVEPASARTGAGGSVDVPLRASVVAPEVPARVPGDCPPRADRADCYRRHPPGAPPAVSVAGAPKHGSAEVRPGEPATLRYRPAAGFSGEDVVTVQATDARGLVSRPAAVRIVVDAPAPVPAPPLHGDPTAPLAERLSPPEVPAALIRGLRVRRLRGRLVLTLTATRAVRLSGRIRRAGAARTVARIAQRRLAPGRRRVALPRLRRHGAHVLSVTARGAGAVQTLRTGFRVRRPPRP